jgi:hypothetical protein
MFVALHHNRVMPHPQPTTLIYVGNINALLDAKLAEEKLAQNLLLVNQVHRTNPAAPRSKEP